MKTPVPVAACSAREHLLSERRQQARDALRVLRVENYARVGTVTNQRQGLLLRAAAHAHFRTPRD